MDTLKLIRHGHYRDRTTGTLSLGTVTLHTLEPPWRLNRTFVSCVPDGLYEVSRYNSRRFKQCFHIKDVPNRRYILIHAGNTVKHTEGCILVGMFAFSKGVGHSRKALKRMLATLPSDFYLSIESHQCTL